MKTINDSATPRYRSDPGSQNGTRTAAKLFDAHACSSSRCAWVRECIRSRWTSAALVSDVPTVMSSTAHARWSTGLLWRNKAVSRKGGCTPSRMSIHSVSVRECSALASTPSPGYHDDTTNMTVP